MFESQSEVVGSEEFLERRKINRATDKHWQYIPFFGGCNMKWMRGMGMIRSDRSDYTM